MKTTIHCSLPSFNTNQSSWEDSPLKTGYDLRTPKKSSMKICQCEIYKSLWKKKNLTSLMTWMANVWVRCLKPMKYKTFGRAPILFKVPGQCCQLLCCSWQLSLDSLWINSKIEMEEMMWPRLSKETVEGFQWLPEEDASWWALKAKD
jgi:hypothetical protein